MKREREKNVKSVTQITAIPKRIRLKKHKTITRTKQKNAEQKQMKKKTSEKKIKQEKFYENKTKIIYE